MKLPYIRWISLAFVAVLVVACGGDDDDAGAAPAGGDATSPTSATPETPVTPATSTEPADSGGGVSEACDLTEPDVVASVFDATSGTEEPGIARNCTYMLTGGMTDQVDVFYYGTSAEWDGIRGGYDDNRGPLTDVAGVGDEAFYPGDVGEYELVVRSGDVVYAVSYIAGVTPPNYAELLRTLALEIAAGL